MYIVCVCPGLFNDNFDLGTVGVGDLMDISDEESSEKSKKNKKGGLPDLEGTESLRDYLTKYKRTVLNKRAAFKDVEERLSKDGVKGHEQLGTNTPGTFCCECCEQACALSLGCPHVHNSPGMISDNCRAR
jgi:hypothetical protein